MDVSVEKLRLRPCVHPRSCLPNLPNATRTEAVIHRHARTHARVQTTLMQLNSTLSRNKTYVRACKHTHTHRRQNWPRCAFIHSSPRSTRTICQINDFMTVNKLDVNFRSDSKMFFFIRIKSARIQVCSSEVETFLTRARRRHK